MTRRPAKRRPLTGRGVLLGVARVVGALVGWFAFTGLFTVALMLLGIHR